MNLPFPEARDRLLNRVKQDNAEFKQLERDEQDLRRMIETYQRNIKEIDQDLKEKKPDGEEAQKYEILYQKEKEINDFMEKFEEEKVQYEGQIQKHQETIVNLLTHMHEDMERQHKLPTSEQVRDMKGELAFKENQLESAGTTFARLKVEMEQRQNDLEKINTLETRIEKEMEQAQEKIAQMEDEMNNKFTRTDDLKDEVEREKIRLQGLKKLLEQMKPGIQKQMTYHSMKHDTKKN